MATLDVVAFYKLNNRLRLSAAVSNLFDENYVHWEIINSVRPGGGGTLLTPVETSP